LRDDATILIINLLDIYLKTQPIYNVRMCTSFLGTVLFYTHGNGGQLHIFPFHIKAGQPLQITTALLSSVWVSGIYRTSNYYVIMKIWTI